MIIICIGFELTYLVEYSDFDITYQIDMVTLFLGKVIHT